MGKTGQARCLPTSSISKTKAWNQWFEPELWLLRFTSWFVRQKADRNWCRYLPNLKANAYLQEVLCIVLECFLLQKRTLTCLLPQNKATCIPPVDHVALRRLGRSIQDEATFGYSQKLLRGLSGSNFVHLVNYSYYEKHMAQNVLAQIKRGIYQHDGYSVLLQDPGQSCYG